MRRVVDALREGLVVPVVTCDERGTTRAAEALLEEAGVPRGRWAEAVDSLAARLILEDHLAACREGIARHDVDRRDADR